MSARAPDSGKIDPADLPDPFVPQVCSADSEDGLRQSLSWWLVGTARLWRNLLDERLKVTDQTQPRWRVLAWAQMLPGIKQADLAERMGISSPTLVRLLDNLEEQNMIERRESSGDRRIKRIYLTKDAEPLVRGIAAEVKRIGDALLQDITADELRSCLDVLRRIRARVPELSDRGLGAMKGFPPAPET
jgi:MarR family transcriptional regulator for hemolysin